MQLTQTLAVALAAFGTAQAAKNGTEEAHISLQVQDGCTVSLLLVPTRTLSAFYRTFTNYAIDAHQVTQSVTTPRVMVYGQVKPTQYVSTAIDCAQYQKDRNGQCATLSAFVYESTVTQYVTSTAYITYPITSQSYSTRQIKSTQTWSEMVPITTTSALNKC